MMALVHHAALLDVGNEPYFQRKPLHEEDHQKVADDQDALPISLVSSAPMGPSWRRGAIRGRDYRGRFGHTYSVRRLPNVIGIG